MYCYGCIVEDDIIQRERISRKKNTIECGRMEVKEMDEKSEK